HVRQRQPDQFPVRRRRVRVPLLYHGSRRFGEMAGAAWLGGRFSRSQRHAGIARFAGHSRSAGGGDHVTPFVFVIIGLLLLVVAIRGTQNDAFTLLKSEFVGAHSFLPWAASILILGAIGYARPVKPVADALVLLVVLVILLKNGGGFFARLNDAIAHPTAPSQSA